jgi:hypothetical protein
MIKKPILILLIGVVSLKVSGQQITNINASLMNESTVRVNYDLQGEVSGQLFRVYLYSSVDQYSLPLEYVDGYVGDDIEAGLNKFIDWDISKELVAFDGELAFEVRATLTFTPISVAFPDKTKIGRGKQHEISWNGTNARENVDIQLFRNGAKVQTIAHTINDGSYDWDVPYSIIPGKGYAIRISSTSSSESDTGNEFTIRRKVPLMFKLIPFVIITPVIIKLTEEEPSEPKLLPKPPNTPD